MRDATLTCPGPRASIPARDEQDADLWAIVLIGGAGQRAGSLAGPANGVEPADPLTAGAKSSLALRQTLAHVGLLVPPSRTVVVTHAGCAPRLDDLADVRVIAQPADRGSAAGVLLPAHWIHARDPRGRVAVFAAYHSILGEAVFRRHVDGVTRFVAAHPEWLVLLGAEPTAPDTHHGWIEPGERVGWVGADPVNEVRGFWEEPPEELARGLFQQGCLWHSFVFVTSVAVLIEAGLRCLPLLHDRLARLEIFAGTRYEPWALRQAYEFAPTADFARAVLQSPSAPLAVSRIPVRVPLMTSAPGGVG
jgi:mannose-1-phosphate guanylyltransferase